jgi:pimeloyl-ACP methyl ester carboxylesterase
VTLLFCHGLESGPHGRKTHALVDAGFEVEAPDCRGEDLAARVTRLHRAIVDAAEPPLVVGSSFGGIAGLLAALLAAREGVRVPGILLLAPALQLSPPASVDVELACPSPTIIIHGRHDEVIPIDVSRRFARTHGAELIEVDDDHALAGSLGEIIAAVRRLLGHDGRS